MFPQSNEVQEREDSPQEDAFPEGALVGGCDALGDPFHGLSSFPLSQPEGFAPAALHRFHGSVLFQFFQDCARVGTAA